MKPFQHYQFLVKAMLILKKKLINSLHKELVKYKRRMSIGTIYYR